MDPKRRVRSRRGDLLKLLASEKDRHRRPGTPLRNQRPPNSVRATESAVPIHTFFSEAGKNLNHGETEERMTRERTFVQSSAPPRDVDELKSNLEQPNGGSAFKETAPAEDPYSSEVLFRRPSPLIGRAPQTDSSGSVINRSETFTKSPTQLAYEIRQVPTKTQSTNTAHTQAGVPPLEGVHAAFGFGLESWSEFHQEEQNRTLSSSYEYYAYLTNLKDCIDRPSHLRVPSSIVFEKIPGKRRAFAGMVTIRNSSQYFMTFCVKASEPELFEIAPSVGMVLPLETHQVQIKTNPKYDFIFADISSEVFKVWATPVYTRSHMKTEKLEVLWRALGTPMFPRIAAEEHTINFVYHNARAKDSLLASISRNHRWLSALWGNTKSVPLNDNPVSDEEFYQVWPLEDDHYNFMTCKNQLDGWFWHLKKAREETHQMRCEMRQCVAILFLVLFIGVVLCTNVYPVPSSFRISHDYLHGAVDWLGDWVTSSFKQPKTLSQWDRFGVYLAPWHWI